MTDKNAAGEDNPPYHSRIRALLQPRGGIRGYYRRLTAVIRRLGCHNGCDNPLSQLSVAARDGGTIATQGEEGKRGEGQLGSAQPCKGWGVAQGRTEGLRCTGRDMCGHMPHGCQCMRTTGCQHQEFMLQLVHGHFGLHGHHRPGIGGRSRRTGDVDGHVEFNSRRLRSFGLFIRFASLLISFFAPVALQLGAHTRASRCCHLG